MNEGQKILGGGFSAGVPCAPSTHATEAKKMTMIIICKTGLTFDVLSVEPETGAVSVICTKCCLGEAKQVQRAQNAVLVPYK